MTGLYVASVLFGTVLIGTSLVFGHGDHGADHAGPDHDHDGTGGHDGGGQDGDVHGQGGDVHGAGGNDVHGHSEAIWLPFLSMRFWSFLAFAFGLTGLLLGWLGVPSVIAAALAAANGALVGTGAAWAFRQLRVAQVSGETRLDRLVGMEAKVVLPVRPGGKGKIAVLTMADRVELPAVTRDGEPLAPGAAVLVTHVKDGVAEVTAMPRLPGPVGP